MSNKSVTLTLKTGESFKIPLSAENNREVAMLLVDNVPYHFERLKKNELMTQYRVDTDPSYKPQGDANDKCCILSPFSE